MRTEHNPGTVRAHIAQEHKQRSTVLGLAIFLFNAVAYVACLGGALTLVSLPLRLACGLLAGWCIGSLFTIGHDACHNSFTASSKLNEWIGRLAFMPSLVPFTCWKYSHNYLHHGHTNLKNSDHVWRPACLHEFRTFPWYRRWFERLLRCLGGLPLAWIAEWLRYDMFPSKQAIEGMKRYRYRLVDQALVYLFGLGLLVLIVGCSAQPGASVAANASFIAQGLLFCFVVPFVYWSVIMSFVTLLHHTHPSIPWFQDRDEWSYFNSQVRSTVHIELPLMMRWLFHNILEHTAHHVDPRIPMYRLHDAQLDLEKSYPGEITHTPFSFALLFEIYRKCKLYDYDNHQWTDFRGNATTGRLFPFAEADWHASPTAPRVDPAVRQRVPLQKMPESGRPVGR